MIGGTAIKPVGWDRTGLQAFAYFLCDPQKGTILTRWTNMEKKNFRNQFHVKSIFLQNSSVLVEDHRLLQHFLLFPRHLLDDLSFHLHNGELIIDINMVLTVRVYPAFNVKTLPYEDAGPKWQLDQGLIGVDPGVRFIHIFYLFLGQTQVAIRPSNPDFRVESQMIVLKVQFSFLLFLY